MIHELEVLPDAASVASRGAEIVLEAARAAVDEHGSFGLALSVTLFSVGMWGLGRYSASCWPAFLGLGALVARRPTLAMLMLCAFAVCQGLFYHLHIHQYPVM